MDKFGSAAGGAGDSNSMQNLQTAALQQASNFAATNAFAAQQQLPPGYAYFYGQIPNQANIAAAYGAAGAAASALYPATAMAPVPTGGNNSNKFNQGYGTQSYGSGGYDTGLGQNKDFGSSTGGYGNNGAGGGGKSSAAGAAMNSSGAGGAGKGHQYW